MNDVPVTQNSSTPPPKNLKKKTTLGESDTCATYFFF